MLWKHFASLGLAENWAKEAVGRAECEDCVLRPLGRQCAGFPKQNVSAKTRAHMEEGRFQAPARTTATYFSKSISLIVFAITPDIRP